MSDIESRPPIPASLADRPVRGGIALPWINVELADGGADFRSTHRTKFEAAWRDCRCQSCGNLIRPLAVLVCGPRQILSGRYDEPPVCPPCALYASRACPMVGGRVITYPDRARVVEGHRGEKCGDPGCGCAGWVNIDEEHSADMGGQPALPWYAAWHRAGAWTLTGHYATVTCSDLGCRHEQLMISGAQADGPPLKVLLISEPGNGRIWQPLTAEEARDHASAALTATLGNPPPWDTGQHPPGRYGGSQSRADGNTGDRTARGRTIAMGVSTNGMLAYGYDLGGGEDEFKVRETGEYGELKLDWLPANAEDDDDELDIIDLMEKRLLAASGFTETYEDGIEGYFGRERAAKEALGVEVDSYCSGYYPMFVLAAKIITAYRGDCDVIDMAALSDPALLAGYDGKLAAALAALGITPVQDKPAWLLCSYWG